MTKVRSTRDSPMSLGKDCGTADTELAVRADKAIVPVSKDFHGAFLAEGFVEGSHEGVVALIHVGVALTLGYEDVGVEITVDGLLDEDAIAIVVAIGVGNFFGDSLGIDGLFGFDFGDVNIEIVALS